jgi:calcineurin-like phosphoesterase family protein
MSNVYFISDLHLGHDKIHEFAGEFRGGVKNVDEHSEWIIQQWNSVVKKQDLVFVTGDVCFNKKYLHQLKMLKGSKHLIFGNHDKESLGEYLKYFNKVHGFMKYKGEAWLSHSPIHPQSLRGLFNVHGHVHQNSLDDLRYINISVEALNGRPVSWEMLKTIMDERRLLIRSMQKAQQAPSITNVLTAATTGTSRKDDIED